MFCSALDFQPIRSFLRPATYPKECMGTWWITLSLVIKYHPSVRHKPPQFSRQIKYEVQCSGFPEQRHVGAVRNSWSVFQLMWFVVLSMWNVVSLRLQNGKGCSIRRFNAGPWWDIPWLTPENSPKWVLNESTFKLIRSVFKGHRSNHSSRQLTMFFSPAGRMARPQAYRGWLKY